MKTERCEAVIARSAATRQSMQSKGMDRHGLRPRDDEEEKGLAMTKKKGPRDEEERRGLAMTKENGPRDDETMCPEYRTD